MFKDIKKILNSIGDGLSYANAGEMLDHEQKMDVLESPKHHKEKVSEKTKSVIVLSGDNGFTSGSLDNAITLCRKNHAILHLLYVSTKTHEIPTNMGGILERLKAENSLEYQLNYRSGDFLNETHAYLRNTQNTQMILMSISNSPGERANQLQGENSKSGYLTC